MDLRYLLVTQVIIFCAYVLYIVERFGVLDSISESWYRLGLSEKVLFTLFTWGIGIPMLLYGSESLFISGAGLCFVGAATQFKMKDTYTRLIHYAGAIIGLFLPLFFFSLSFNISAPLMVQIFGSLIIIFIEEIKHKLWWIEILGFMTVMVGMHYAIPLMESVGY